MIGLSLRVVFLGTGGSVPTSMRGLPAVLIRREGECLLFDCGEGTQRQMVRTRASFHRRMKVFVSHMHGDHVLGLPGLLQTMALQDRRGKLEVYGPSGIARFLECVGRTVQFVLTFPVEVHEVEREGVVCEEDGYVVEAVWAHHAVPCLAFAFVEKARPGRFFPGKAKRFGVPEGPLWGKLQSGHSARLPDGRIVRPEQVVGSARTGRRIVFSGDTRPFAELMRLAAGADLLVHDATLDDSLTERAAEDGHSTAVQAAEDARKAKVKRLVLTHVSARYRDASVLLAEARKVFKNTVVAEDFMEIEIPLLRGQRAKVPG